MLDEAVEDLKSSRWKFWRWVVLGLILVVVGVGIAATIMVQRAGPILKGRIIETLATRFDSKVELAGFDVSVLNGLEVAGTGLRIYAPKDIVAAGWTHPMFSIDRFTFRVPIRGLFEKPMRVGSVHVTGFAIDIPPREMRTAVVKENRHEKKQEGQGKIKIVVDEIVCDGSHLIVETMKPNKDPKDFEIEHIELHHVGPDAPLAFQALLINPIPKGDAHISGDFGPWVTESPGDSMVRGHYVFDHADLNTIRGLGGILTSTGDFTGQLNRIAVQGKTQTPDFSLDSANHPMPLTTQFHATVDGMTGDTYLDSVSAILGQTSFTTQGEIVNIKGKGHEINLDVHVPAGRIQDFFAVAIKTEPPILTGVFTTHTRLHIPPGKARVLDKLTLDGDLKLTRIHFTNPQVEDKVDDLSLRAQGDAKDAKAGAPDVQSQMTGRFVLNGGSFKVTNLVYTLPGAHADLDGIYSLDGAQFDFHGMVFTQAKVSQMVASHWKSFLLKAVDPLFKGEQGGAKIPVHISGTKSAPKFGLDLHYKDEAKINAQADRKHP